MVDLRPAGDAGLDAVALPEIGDLLGKSLDELGPLRPGPDQRHLSAQHIEQLWQFVQPDHTKKFAQAHELLPYLVIGLVLSAVTIYFRPGLLIHKKGSKIATA